MRGLVLGVLVLSMCAQVGCESADPAASPGASAGPSGGATAALCDRDGAAPLPPPSSACIADASFYTPRDPSSAGKRYPSCISDDNAYHPFQADVPSNARLSAIEQIKALLAVDGGRAPSPADFEQARLAYTQPEGVDSRVQRREDIHYPEAPKLCRDMTPDEIAAHRDRCVGAGKIIPILNDAFDKGTKGIEPSVQAARIEAALIWFMYVSYYKEGLGCGAELNQCDSTSAYWAGQQDRSAAPTGGLGRYVKPLSEEAYQRGWDAVLAMRCWRDVDNPSGEAQDKALEARVAAQLDPAGDHALALIVRHRLQSVSCAPAFASVKVLGGVLDRAATARDAVQASVLREELAKADAAQVDVARAIAAIEAMFPCP